MRKRLPLLLLPFLTGCFEDEPQLPQYYSKQYIDVAVDSVICFSYYEGFDHFELTCSNFHETKRWYKFWYDNFLGIQSEYLGSDNIIYYPIYPHIASSYADVVCYGITGNDTTVYNLDVNYCARNIYIPLAFSPNQDGINDNWYPQLYFTYPEQVIPSHTIYWEIRTLEGVKIFEGNDEIDRWNGTYNGHRMPVGSYLYYIELDIEGEGPVVYTGWLELFG